MLRIAICDDCREFLLHAEKIVTQWKSDLGETAVRTFTDGDALITAHLSSSFDIILLDVVMPLVNGIETAREIRALDKNVKIVFLTSSPEFAVESYTVKADNYLLKPVDVGALHRCLNELIEEMKRSARSIMIKSSSATHRVALFRIEYVEAQNKHTRVFLADGGSIESIEPMNVYENRLLLSDGFFKCHRSYIVNLNLIDHYTSTELWTRSGGRIPISRRIHKEFESAYFTVLFGEGGE